MLRNVQYGYYSVRNKPCLSNHIHTLMELNFAVVLNAFCTALRIQMSSVGREEVNCVSFKPKIFASEKYALAHTRVDIHVCVVCPAKGGLL